MPKDRACFYKASFQRSLPSKDNYKVILVENLLVENHEIFEIKIITVDAYKVYLNKSYCMIIAIIDRFATELQEILDVMLAHLKSKTFNSEYIIQELKKQGIDLKPVITINPYLYDANFFLLYDQGTPNEHIISIIKYRISFLFEFIAECNQKNVDMGMQDVFDQENNLYKALEKLNQKTEYMNGSVYHKKVKKCIERLVFIDYYISYAYLMTIKKILEIISPKLNKLLGERNSIEKIINEIQQIDSEIINLEDNNSFPSEEFKKSVLDKAREFFAEIDEQTQSVRHHLQTLVIKIEKICAQLQLEHFPKLAKKTELLDSSIDLKLKLAVGIESFTVLNYQFLNSSLVNKLLDFRNKCTDCEKKFYDLLYLSKINLIYKYKKKIKRSKELSLGYSDKYPVKNILEKLDILEFYLENCYIDDFKPFNTIIGNIEKAFTELIKIFEKITHNETHSIHRFFDINELIIKNIQAHANKISKQFWGGAEKASILNIIVSELNIIKKYNESLQKNWSTNYWPINAKKRKKITDDFNKLKSTIARNREKIDRYRGVPFFSSIPFFKYVARCWGGGRVLSKQFIENIEEQLLSTEKQLTEVDSGVELSIDDSDVGLSIDYSHL